MDEFPSNSYQNKQPKSDKPERPKMEKVTSSEPRTRQKSLGKKIAETFTPDDSTSIGQYILFDVLIPQAKNTILEAINEGLSRAFYGDTSRPVRSNTGRQHTPYNRMSSSPLRGVAQTSGRRDISHKARRSHDFNEIILESRGEAEEVLDRLTDLVKDYDHATIADMYDLVGVTGEITDDRWGWTSMAGAGVRRISTGYILVMPKPEPID